MNKRERVFDALAHLLCRLGIRAKYKHDGEWTDQCAFCDYGHPPRGSDEKQDFENLVDTLIGHAHLLGLLGECDLVDIAAAKQGIATAKAALLSAYEVKGRHD
jgi:hypothetical protein